MKCTDWVYEYKKWENKTHGLKCTGWVYEYKKWENKTYIYIYLLSYNGKSFFKQKLFNSSSCVDLKKAMCRFEKKYCKKKEQKYGEIMG